MPLIYEGERQPSYIHVLLPVAVKYLRGLLFRLFRRVRGQHFFISSGVKLIGPGDKLSVGKLSKIERDCIIQTFSIKGIVLGSKVTIGEGCMIRPSSYYGGELGEGLSVGNGSAIGVNSYIGCSGFISIGNDVIIGPKLTAIAENHNFSDIDINIKDQGVTRDNIIIEDDVWIGCNVTILSGVTVGSHSIIAAGSVVTKDIEPYSIVAGIPGRIIKSRK